VITEQRSAQKLWRGTGVPSYLRGVQREIRTQLSSGDEAEVVAGLAKLECCVKLKLLGLTALEVSRICALAGSDAPQARLVVARLLGLIGGHTIKRTRALLGLVLDADSGIRDSACQSLEGTMDPRARAALMARLRDKDDQVRFSALMALGGRSKDVTMRRLQQCLGDESGLVRLACVQVLYERAVADRPALDKVRRLLRKHMENERDGIVRAEGLGVLCRLGDQNGLPEIIKLCQSDNPAVRYRACDELGVLVNIENADEILMALKSARAKEYSAHRPRIREMERKIRCCIRFAKGDPDPWSTD
jgi:hypothetical protein